MTWSDPYDPDLDNEEELPNGDPDDLDDLDAENDEEDESTQDTNGSER